MGLFSGDIYIAAGVILIAIAADLLRVDPKRREKETREYYKKLYAQDAIRNSRR